VCHWLSPFAAFPVRLKIYRTTILLTQQLSPRYGRFMVEQWEVPVTDPYFVMAIVTVLAMVALLRPWNW
jgi:hypothetical protein